MSTMNGMEKARTRIKSIIAAFCIASSLATVLTGCDKIDELRNSLSRRPERRGKGRIQEGGVLTERGDQSAVGLQQAASQNTPGYNPQVSGQSLANDIAARSIAFVPGSASDASGVLKATFDNTFVMPADVAVVISVDGVVVANGATRVPPQSRWMYSAPYTFTTSGDHALRMGAYLKGGMPTPESDMSNNEVAGIGSVSQDTIARSAAAVQGRQQQSQAVSENAQVMDLNDIEARSIGFMPDGSTRYTSQAVVGQPGVIRTTFSNGFNYDANLRVNIIDDDIILSDVILAVPRRAQGAYFVKHIFDKPGVHKIKLSVYQADAAYQERNPINNEMTTVINVIAPPENAAANRDYAQKDIIARGISFQSEGAGAAANMVETGVVGRVKLDYTSTFTGNSDLVISWIIDGNVIAETPVKSVPPGDHYSLMGYTFDAAGTHSIAAEIRLTGEANIEEGDIKNNKAEASVEVVLPPDASAVPQSPQRMDSPLMFQPQFKTPTAGFALVGPLDQQTVSYAAPIAAEQTGQGDVAPPIVPEGTVSHSGYDLVAESIVFMAAPGNVPIASAGVGQGGALAYVVKNRSGAAKGVEVKIRMELEGKSKFSLTKKIDISDSGIFEGTTGNLVLSQPGRYALYLSADNPDNSPSSRSERYFEFKRVLDVLPRAN